MIQEQRDSKAGKSPRGNDFAPPSVVLSLDATPSFPVHRRIVHRCLCLALSSSGDVGSYREGTAYRRVLGWYFHSALSSSDHVGSYTQFSVHRCVVRRCFHLVLSPSDDVASSMQSLSTDVSFVGALTLLCHQITT